jgi:tRNA dimethylallyltransferase
MMAAGALEEVRALLALGLSRELPAMRALGVAPLVAHLEGRLPLADAVAAAKSDTRKYARRQLTWLRRNMITWNAVSEQEMQRLIGGDFSFIDP